MSITISFSKNIHLKILCIFIFLYFITLHNIFAKGVSSIEVISRTDKTQIALHETIKYIIEVKWEGKNQLYTVEWPLKLNVHNLVLMGNSEKVEIFKENGRFFSRRLCSYILKPESAGTAAIGVNVVSVKSNKGSATFNQETKPIYIKVFTPPVSSKKYYLITLSIIFCVVGIILIGRWLYRKKQNKKQEDTKKILSPYEKAMNLLNEAELKRKSGEYKSYFELLDRTLKNYFNEKFGLKISSSNSFIEAINSNQDFKDFINIIEEIITTCDMVKFGGTLPPAVEIDKYTRKTKEVLEKINIKQKQTNV